MPADFMTYFAVGLGIATIAGFFGGGIGMVHDFFDRSTTHVFEKDF